MYVCRGWDGFVVSDYDAWANIIGTHHFTKTMTEAAAVGINAGRKDLDTSRFTRNKNLCLPLGIASLVSATLLYPPPTTHLPTYLPLTCPPTHHSSTLTHSLALALPTAALA